MRVHFHTYSIENQNGDAFSNIDLRGLVSYPTGRSLTLLL